MRIHPKSTTWVTACVFFLCGTGAAVAQAPLHRVLAPGSAEPDGFLNEPAISADGRTLVFTSLAGNLLPGANDRVNVYRYGIDSGVLQRISRVPGTGVAGNGDCHAPAASSDGRVIAFESYASNLLPGSNLKSHVYRYDTGTGDMTRIDNTTQGVAADGDGQTPALSADGRYTAFVSFAGDLVPGDGNGRRDLFLHDAVSGTVSILSRNRFGQFADGDVDLLNPQAISGDGRYVVFASRASLMTPAGGNGQPQVYLHDRDTDTHTLLSISTTGGPGDAGGDQPSISPNGRYVVFRSASTNLTAAANPGRLFRLDRQSGTLIAVPRPVAADFSPPLSAAPNTCRVPFVSDAGDVLATCDFTPPQTPQVFAWRAANTHWRLVSRASSGASTFGNQRSGPGAGLSADGQRLVFTSEAGNLLPGDANGLRDVYFEAFTTPGLMFADGFE